MSDWSQWAGRPGVRGLVNLGFHLDARLRTAERAWSDPITVQQQTLDRLVRRARRTQFGRDHGFDRIRSVRSFQKAVPVRTYESLWNGYLRDRYPVFEDL